MSTADMAVSARTASTHRVNPSIQASGFVDVDLFPALSWSTGSISCLYRRAPRRTSSNETDAFVTKAELLIRPSVMAAR
jgi:hypothetical protein